MKFDIGYKDRTYHYEADVDLSGKKLGEVIKGEEISTDLAGYEFIITGASDKSGFPAKANLEGMGVKRLLLKKGFGMKEKPKGLRLRKSIRGNTISKDIMQLNLKVTKEGPKPLSEIFKKPEVEAESKE